MGMVCSRHLSLSLSAHLRACRSDNNTLPEPLRLILEDPNHPQANQFPYDVAVHRSLFSEIAFENSP